MSAGGARAGSGRPMGATSAEHLKGDLRVDIRAKAREHGAECVKWLYEMAQDKKNGVTARTVVIKELLDRGFGKAPQSIDIDLGATLNVDSSDLAQVIVNILAPAGNGADKPLLFGGPREGMAESVPLAPPGRVISEADLGPIGRAWNDARPDGVPAFDKAGKALEALGEALTDARPDETDD